MNILSLNAVLLVLDGRASGVSTRGRRPAGPVTVPMQRMAKLLSPSEMPGPVARLAAEMNLLGETGDGRILASLYRYLANWPMFMALAWALIRPLHDSGWLHDAARGALADADAKAQLIAPRLYTGAAPLEGAVVAAMHPALQDFSRNAIAKVLPITAALLRAVEA